jgi:hypothetical protein
VSSCLDTGGLCRFCQEDSRGEDIEMRRAGFGDSLFIRWAVQQLGKYSPRAHFAVPFICSGPIGIREQQTLPRLLAADCLHNRLG